MTEDFLDDRRQMVSSVAKVSLVLQVSLKIQVEASIRINGMRRNKTTKKIE